MSAASARSVGYGATLVTLSQVASIAAMGALSVVMARTLGPAGTGTFNLVLTALTIVVLFVSFGIENGVSYHVGGKRWPPAVALRQTTAAALPLGVLGGAVGIGVGLLTSGSLFANVDPLVIVLGLAATPAMLSWTFGSFLALATADYPTYLLGPATQALACLVIVAPASILGGVTAAVAGLAVSHLVAAVALRVTLARRLARTPASGGDTLADLVRAARFGIPAQLTNALSLLTYRADLFVLNAAATTASVGQYAIATSLTSLGWVAPRAVSAVILPRIARLDAPEDDAQQRLLIAKAVRHAIVLALGVCAILAIGAQLIPLVYGDAFRPAVELTLLLLPGIFTLGVGNIFASTILGKGAPRYSLIVTGVVAPLTIVLYLVLIPRHGAPGAAVASSISYTASAALYYVFFRRISGIRGVLVLLPRRDEVADYVRLVRATLARASS